jgi:hypothetical protein
MSRGSAPPSSYGAAALPREAEARVGRGPSRAPRPRARGARALTVGEATVGLVCRELVVAPRDVVFVKGVVEASEGLATLFAERGGTLTLASTPSQARELDAFVSELRETLEREHLEPRRLEHEPFEVVAVSRS